MARIGFLAAAAAAGLLAVLASRPALASIYSFDFGGNSFDSTPGTVSTGGLTVTFSSPTDPGQFSIADTAGNFVLFDGLALTDNGSGGDVLTLTFSQPINGLAFYFALDDFQAAGLKGPDVLSVTVNGTTTDFPAVVYPYPGAIFPENHGSFSGNPFTTVQITSAYDFAIALTNVPEPASLAVLATALIGLAALRRRRAPR